MTARTLFAAGLTGALLLTGPAAAHPASTSQTGNHKTHEVRSDAEIRGLIAEWVRRHPEKIVESLENLRRQLEGDGMLPVSGELRERVENPEIGYAARIAGTPGAPVTIVEFFDPNCPYCRRAVEEVEQLLASRDDVQMLVRPFPVISEGSTGASQVAWALGQQGLYREWLRELSALSRDPRRLDRAGALKIAEALGADVEAIEQQSYSLPAARALRVNIELAKALQVAGTPTFVINGEIVRGALSFAALEARVEAALAESDGRASTPATPHAPENSTQ